MDDVCMKGLTPRIQLGSRYPYEQRLRRLLLSCLRVLWLSQRACSPSVLRALNDH